MFTQNASFAPPPQPNSWAQHGGDRAHDDEVDDDANHRLVASRKALEGGQGLNRCRHRRHPRSLPLHPAVSLKRDHRRARSTTKYSTEPHYGSGMGGELTRNTFTISIPVELAFPI